MYIAASPSLERKDGTAVVLGVCSRAFSWTQADKPARLPGWWHDGTLLWWARGGLENHGRLLPQPGSHSRLFSSHFIGQKKTQALCNFKRTRRHRGGAECVENITMSATAVIPAEVCLSAATPQWSLVCIFEQHIGILFPLLQTRKLINSL